jgi:hypothetical protein
MIRIVINFFGTFFTFFHRCKFIIDLLLKNVQVPSDIFILFFTVNLTVGMKRVFEQQFCVALPWKTCTNLLGFNFSLNDWSKIPCLHSTSSSKFTKNTGAGL